VLFLGLTPTERLQDWLHDPASSAWYDYATWAVHLSHFLVSTTLLVVLWRLGSPLFRRLLVGLLVLSYAALATYWAYPAVPPWLASDQGHLGEVSRVVHHVWSDAGVERAPRLLSAGGGSGGASESPFSDPVAALPSLHAAIPLLLTLTLQGLDRRLTALLSAYTLAMGLALVYGGEHYVFDVLVGWGVRVRRLGGHRARAARVGPGERAGGAPRAAATTPAAAALLRSPLALAGRRGPAPAARARVTGPARRGRATCSSPPTRARGGPFLYGDLWVDRPPLLVALLPARRRARRAARRPLLALVAVVVLVLAAADAGRTLGGARGATWAAAVAAGCPPPRCSGATALNGELLGAPFVLSPARSACARCSAPAPGRGRLAGAGALGAARCSSSRTSPTPSCCSPSSWSSLAVRRELGPCAGALRLLAALAAGAAVPLLLTLVWATGWGASAARPVGDRRRLPHRLGRASSTTTPPRRCARLCCWARRGRRRHRARCWSLLAVAARPAGGRRPRRRGRRRHGRHGAWCRWRSGGSFWRHYLLQLVPATALAPPCSPRRRAGPALGAGRQRSLAVSAAVGASAARGPGSATAGRTCGAAGRARLAAARVGSRRHRRHAVRRQQRAARQRRPPGLPLPVEPAGPHARPAAGPPARRGVRARTGATWVVRTLPLHSWGWTASGGSPASCGPPTGRWRRCAARRSCCATGPSGRRRRSSRTHLAGRVDGPGRMTA
jgi:hypothetical protein